jgi:hypothetical protein
MYERLQFGESFYYRNWPRTASQYNATKLPVANFAAVA